MSPGIALCVSLILAQPEPGAQREIVAAWILSEWERAKQWPVFDGYSIRWRQENNDVPDEQSIARLRTEVAGNKQHPAFKKLESLEAHVAKGPTRIEFEFFSMSASQWRFNCDFGNGMFQDSTLTRNAAWDLWPRSIKLFDPADSATDKPAGDQNQLGNTRDFLPMIGGLFFGGLDIARTDGCSMGTPSIEGNEWRVRVTMAGGSDSQQIVYEFRGHWDAVALRGFVAERLVAENTYNPGTVGSGQRYLDWRRDEATGSWAAGKSVEFTHTGEWVRRFEFLGTRPWPATFDVLTTAPQARGEDAVRGALQTAALYDYRTGTAAILKKDGNWHPGIINTPKNPKPESYEWLRGMGWVCLGVLVVLFIMVKRRGRVRLD